MIRKIFSVVFFLSLLSPAYSQNTSHLKVELLPEQKAIVPGGSVTLGFHFRMEKGWHIYWKNPGDSGQTPSVQWSMPDGFEAGGFIWTIPQRLPIPNLADYGYTNEVMLMVPLKVPAHLKPGRTIRLSAHVRWLVCNEICIPGDAKFNVRLSVRRKTSNNSRNEALFRTARRNLPGEWPEDWKTNGTLGAKDFRLSFETDESYSKSAAALFFPFHPNQVENAPAQVCEISGSSIQLKIKRSDQLQENINTLEGILVISDKTGRRGYTVSVPLSGQE